MTFMLGGMRMTLWAEYESTAVGRFKNTGMMSVYAPSMGFFAKHHRIYHNPGSATRFWIQGAGPYNPQFTLADYLSS